MNSELRRIVATAQTQAWTLVRREVSKTLPKGWTLYLMVGWGMVLHDDVGTPVMADYPDQPLPPRMPKGVRAAVRMASDYVEHFGFNNAKIVGRRT